MQPESCDPGASSAAAANPIGRFVNQVDRPVGQDAVPMDPLARARMLRAQLEAAKHQQTPPQAHDAFAARSVADQQAADAFRAVLSAEDDQALDAALNEEMARAFAQFQPFDRLAESELMASGPLTSDAAEAAMRGCAFRVGHSRSSLAVLHHYHASPPPPPTRTHTSL